jgi:hypothetical protein
MIKGVDDATEFAVTRVRHHILFESDNSLNKSHS